MEILTTILNDENRKRTKEHVKVLIDQLNCRDLLEVENKKKMKEYMAAPEGINPIYDQLEDADTGTLNLCESTINFISQNNTKILNLQRNIDEMAQWIEHQR